MFKNLFSKFYGFVSIGVIEFGTLINDLSNIFTLFIILLQVIIAALTIYKLWKDIKIKKFVSLDKTEKQIEKKHPFLVTLIKYLKK